MSNKISENFEFSCAVIIFHIFCIDNTHKPVCDQSPHWMDMWRLVLTLLLSIVHVKSARTDWEHTKFWLGQAILTHGRHGRRHSLTESINLVQMQCSEQAGQQRVMRPEHMFAVGKAGLEWVLNIGWWLKTSYHASTFGKQTPVDTTVNVLKRQ